MLQNPNFKGLSLMKSKGYSIPNGNHRGFSTGSTDWQLRFCWSLRANRPWGESASLERYTQLQKRKGYGLLIVPRYSFLQTPNKDLAPPCPWGASQTTRGPACHSPTDIHLAHLSFHKGHLFTLMFES